MDIVTWNCKNSIMFRLAGSSMKNAKMNLKDGWTARNASGAGKNVKQAGIFGVSNVTDNPLFSIISHCHFLEFEISFRVVCLFSDMNIFVVSPYTMQETVL